MKPVAHLASLFLFSALGFSGSTSVVAAEGGAGSNPSGTLSVEFGKPTHMQRLYYKKMYDKKPFRDAILFYYDNGLYKIISPGEDHYGSYVVEGSFSDPRYTVHYIAFPSADWNNTSAYHVLEFDNAAGQFTQRAIVPIDGKIPQQHGNFSVGENKVINPLAVDWEHGKSLMPSHSFKE
jgi:hypothetical protein